MIRPSTGASHSVRAKTRPIGSTVQMTKMRKIVSFAAIGAVALIASSAVADTGYVAKDLTEATKIAKSGTLTIGLAALGAGLLALAFAHPAAAQSCENDIGALKQ